MIDICRCTPSEASEYLTRYLRAYMITIVDSEHSLSDYDDIAFDAKSVYKISSKAERISLDIKSGYLGVDIPEVAHIKNGDLLTQIVYIDREGSGKPVMGPEMTKLLLKTFLGRGLPNIAHPPTTEQSVKTGLANLSFHSAASSSSGSHTSSFGQDMIMGIQNTSASLPTSVIPAIRVCDRKTKHAIVNLSFSGRELVDWMMLHTSILTREEGIKLGNRLITKGWIVHALGGEVKPSDAAVGCSVLLQDTDRAIYQPTLSGCELSEWPDIYRPFTKPISRGLLGFIKSRGSDDNLHISADPSSTSLTVSTTTTTTTAAAAIRPALSTTSQQPDTDLYLENDWEICHNHLIPMDGTARSSTIISHIQVIEREIQVFTDPIISKIHRQFHHGHSNTSSSRHSQLLGISTPPTRTSTIVSASDALKPAAIMFDHKETIPSSTRLSIVLSDPELRTAFRQALKALYCVENILFWMDVEGLKKLYADVSPPPPVPAKDSVTTTNTATTASTPPPSHQAIPKHPHIIISILAIYLKYIAPGAPFELNIPVGIQKKLDDIMIREKLVDHVAWIVPDVLGVEAGVFEGPVDGLVVGGEEGMRALTLNGGEDGVCNVDNEGMFHEAQTHVFNMMATDSIPKFLKTAVYSDIMTGRRE